jgi:hypothetical protein
MTPNRPPNSPDKDDPFLLAVRYNDADTEELGLAGAIEKHGLSRSTLEHTAQQRALRLVLAQGGRKDEIVGGAAVALSPTEEALIDGLVPLYMDALLAGWRARGITDAEAQST